MRGPALEYRGVLFPEVPSDAKILQNRVYGVLGAAPTGIHYLARSEFGAVGPDSIYRGLDLSRDLFGSGTRWEGRLIFFGMAARTLANAAQGSQFIHATVELHELDDAGNVLGAVRYLDREILLPPGNTGNFTEVECSQEVPLERPVLTLSPALALVTMNSRIRVSVRHEVGGTAPATTHVEAVATFALFPTPDFRENQE